MNLALAIEIATALSRRFEGFRPRPYLCPAGVPTIGYGATYYEDGRRITLADPPVTRERAELLLAWELQKVCLPAVLRLCPRLDTAERLAAILDFTFNLGAGNLKVSTLRRRIEAQDWPAVRTELLRWNKAGGRILPGLTRRRQAEAELIGD